MRNSAFYCIIAVILFGIFLSTGYGQTVWTKFGGNPILDVGKEGEWDNLYLDGAEILYHEHKYKMWYAASNDFSYENIGYAESDDGIFWQRYPNNPVLTRGDVGEWDRATIGSQHVILDDGIFRLYYSAITGIGLATSSDGITWEKHPDNPIMVSGDSWGPGMITMPCVVKIDSSYYMWYSCYSGSGTNTFQIGYATSKDGIAWRRYEENPVFTFGEPGSWDIGAHANTIIYSNSLFHMWYSAYSDDRGWLIGYATSKNGIDWERFEGNPIINRIMTWERAAIPWCKVIEHDNVRRMWYGGFDNSGVGRIGLATCPKLDHEIALVSISSWLRKAPILVNNFNPLVNIMNYGKEQEELVEISCEIDSQNVQVYNRSETIQTLLPAGSELYTPLFPHFKTNLPFEYDLSFISHLSTDEFKENDTLSTTLIVSNQMDDFENGIHLWDIDSEWSISDDQSVSGDFCLKNGGRGSYADNADAAAVYRYTFDLSLQDAAYIQFKTRYFIQTNKDYGFVEVSSDSGETWQKLDHSFTGIKPVWHTTQISLDEFCGAGFDNIKIRFHFVSDASVNMAGWFIDDVEMYTGNIDTHVKQVDSDVLESYYLYQNYPNPFNPQTQISYNIPKQTHVKIEIYNALGRHVKTLLNSQQAPGQYNILWDGTDQINQKVVSGLYFCRLQVDEYQETIKLVLTK